MRKKTILLVEDDEFVYQTLSKCLERSNFNVLIARNGTEGLQTFMTHHNEIDLVVSDIIMPKASGLDLAKEIKEMSPKTNVIAISGALSRTTLPSINEILDASDEEITKFNIDHFIQKPFSMLTFSSLIEKYLPPDKPN